MFSVKSRNMFSFVKDETIRRGSAAQVANDVT